MALTCRLPFDGKYRSDSIIYSCANKLKYRWFSKDTAHPASAAEMEALFNTTVQGEGYFGKDRSYVAWSGTGGDGYVYAPDGNKPSYLPADSYAYELSGYLNLPTAGTYTIGVDSDDVCELFLDGNLVASSVYAGEGFRGFDTKNCYITQSMTAGPHNIIARFEEGTGGDGISIGWKRPGETLWSFIPMSYFSIAPIDIVNNDGAIFDGVNDEVIIKPNRYPSGCYCSISCWIKPTASQTAGIITQRGDTSQHYRGLSIEGLDVYAWSRDQDSVWQQTTGYSLTQNKWYNVIFVQDVNIIKLYVDGVLIATKEMSSHYPHFSSYFAIGNYTNSNLYFNGYIKDVHIYDHPLSMKEIKELSKSKTLHYTFNQFQEPTVNLISNHLINTTDIKNGYNGWLTIGTGNDTRKFIHNSNVPVNPNNIYTFSCIYYSSGNIGDGDVYLRFDGTGYSEGNVYLQPLINTPHHISYNTINLGGGFYYREGTFTTTSDTNNITQIFYDSDVSGIEIFIANLQLEAKDHATPFVDGVRKGNVGDCAGINNTDLGKLSDKNILDPSTWVLGTKGSQTGFSQNGDGNSIILANGPHNKLASIWQAWRNDTASDADGGWTTSSFSIDNTSTYRFSVWINRVTKGNGHVYFGCHGYGSTNGVIRLSDSTNNTNPYFNVQDVGEYDADLSYNTWYLFVGHVLPSNHTGTTNHVLSGIYDIHGNKVVAAEYDYKWRAETTTADHRTYLYYSTDPSTEVRWAYPRVDKCDGTHPSIQELIAGLDIRKSPKWVEGGPVGSGYYEFDGEIQRIDLPNTLYIQAQENHSYSAWVKLNNGYSTEGAIIAGARSTTNSFTVLSDKRLCGREDDVTVISSTYLSEDIWYYVTYTFEFDGINTAVLKVYINGNLEGTTTETAYVDNFSNNTNYIGYDSRYEFYFNGSISDVRIYSTALSADDVREIYQSRASIDKGGNFYVNMMKEFTDRWKYEIDNYNLVENGCHEYKNNYNFPGFTYISSGNYLSLTSGATTKLTDNYIKLIGNGYNSWDQYKLEGYIKGETEASRYYFMISCYDKYYNWIAYENVYHFSNTATTLAQDLNNGESWVYVNEIANWYDDGVVGYNHQKTISLWHPNDERPLYEPYVYTKRTLRNVDQVDFTNKRVHLTSPYSGITIPAGSPAINSRSGGTYGYIGASNDITNLNNWEYKYGITSTTPDVGNVRYGTTYIKVGFLINRDAINPTTLIRNIKFYNLNKPQNFISEFDKNKMYKTGVLKQNTFNTVGPTNGLVLYMPLNGDTKDYSGNKNDGTNNGATVVQGLGNKLAYSFDGIDDYIDCGSGESLDITEAITLSAWIKSDSTYSQWTRLIWKQDDSYRLHIDPLNKIRMTVEDPGQTIGDAIGNPITVGEWKYIVGTFDGSTICLYENGFLVDTISWSTGLSSQPNDKLYIGGSNYYFNGKMQDVCIYNRALSQQEISWLYDMYNPNKNIGAKIFNNNIIYAHSFKEGY